MQPFGPGLSMFSFLWCSWPLTPNCSIPFPGHACSRTPHGFAVLFPLPGEVSPPCLAWFPPAYAVSPSLNVTSSERPFLKPPESRYDYLHLFVNFLPMIY